MKIKTNELTGPALRWAVATANGMPMEWDTDERDFWVETAHSYGFLGKLFNPHTDWAQGGPLIEREHITLESAVGNGWKASVREGYGTYLTKARFGHYGETALIAAMRCYVASKLGDEVNVPGELTP